MRATVLSVAVLTALTASALAEPRSAHPQPTPSALTEPDTSDDPARASAKAQQDAFDKRIADRSERAMRSICVGCSGGSAQARWAAPKRIETTEAEADDDFVVEEQAAAPAR